MDFCEGGEGFVCFWFIWEDCKGECYTFTRKASATDTKKDKVSVLLSSLPNEFALVTDSDDDSLVPMRCSMTLRRSLIRHMHLFLRARFLHVGRASGPYS